MCRSDRRDRVVAMQTGDLLDEILFDCEIEPVGRRRDEEMIAGTLEGKAEAAEHRRDRRIGYVDAEKPSDARGSHANGVALWQLTLHIGDGTGLTSADFRDE